MNENLLEHFLDLPEAQNGATATAGETAYIWIHNWDAVQTYQIKRNKYWAPPWIKLHADLYEQDEFLRLPIATRMLLVGLFIAFATSRGRIANDTRTISRRLHQRVTNQQLEALNHAGYIDFCSGTVREQRWAAFMNSSNREKIREEVDKKPLKPPFRKRRKKQPQVCPDCEVGGGLHSEECPTVKPADDFLDSLTSEGGHE